MSLVAYVSCEEKENESDDATIGQIGKRLESTGMEPWEAFSVLDEILQAQEFQSTITGAFFLIDTP
jgi:hypothetical protein